MGRKPTKTGAIPRFRVRPQKSGVVHYYYDHGGKPRKETPLGCDYGLAIKRWAELEHAQITPAIAVTFRHVAERYRAEVIPTKAYNTQRMHYIYLNYLLQFFDDPPAPFESIKPVNIRQYLDWRHFKVSANREVALFSHLWNWARSKGITDLPNPCAGIRRNKESGRDVYIDDTTYHAVYQAADQTLRDAMDLAYLTGQRVSDVLSMDERHIVNGALEICQAKTGVKLAIAITGELAVLIKRIFDRKRGLKLRSTRLIVDEKGLGLNWKKLAYRFRKVRAAAGIAKEIFQFRDLRAKAATDKADLAGDMRQAQAQLGHASVVMTEHYVRKRKGAKVTPTR
ncbi:integrase [Xylella fastidiosa subsp. pauca]|uniref:tyrosine-type recombinase/integrase n=2 Tax=Xylella fastidiosa TaxID=2371 RepID=UPI0005833E60|nr:tyrosine-type recombinase/integrase [Xylella fastidiosa]ARO68740.1 integrase [Xylella fastidiosa subsp. pauca]AVI20822.1 integrase [Xylella fastidiosa]AVI22857.1 integrase [Xylella fastidiosa]KIA58330.1 integrase [Xylella fastidiosa]KXB10478.1 integrase [Xylella fastidiosa]